MKYNDILKSVDRQRLLNDHITPAYVLFDRSLLKTVMEFTEPAMIWPNMEQLYGSKLNFYGLTVIITEAKISEPIVIFKEDL